MVNFGKLKSHCKGKNVAKIRNTDYFVCVGCGTELVLKKGLFGQKFVEKDEDGS